MDPQREPQAARDAPPRPPRLSASLSIQPLGSAPPCAAASGIAGVCRIPTTLKNLAGKIPKGSLYITPEQLAAGLAEYAAGMRRYPSCNNTSSVLYSV